MSIDGKTKKLSDSLKEYELPVGETSPRLTHEKTLTFATDGTTVKTDSENWRAYDSKGNLAQFETKVISDNGEFFNRVYYFGSWGFYVEDLDVDGKRIAEQGTRPAELDAAPALNQTLADITDKSAILVGQSLPKGVAGSPEFAGYDSPNKNK